MSRIVFNKIEFKNFQSFGNNITTVDLDKEQISLICGTNGSGKTCVIQTISYALFGKSLTGISKSELINNKNKRNLWVQLTFTIGNNVYKLTRGDKPSVLELTRNDEPIEVDGDSRIFQKKLETEILKFDFKSFKQLVCLGSEFTRFFKMTAAERRVFIEGILDLQVISEMNALAKEDLKSTKMKLEEFDIQRVQKESNLKIYVEEQEKENRDIQGRKEKLLDEKDQLIIDNSNLTKELATLSTQIEHYTKQENDETIKYNESSAKIAKLSSEGKGLLQIVKDLETEQTFYKEHTQCPVCHQQIGEDFIKRKLAEIVKKLDETNSQIAQIKSIGSEEREHMNLYDEMRKKWSAAKITAIEHQSTSKARIEGNKRRIVDIDNEITTLNSNKKGGTRDIAIANLKDELTDLSIKIKNYNGRVDIFNQILQILSDSGVKQAIITNYIDYINQQLAVYLERFNFNFSIEFDSEFNDTILMDFRDQVQYESLSEGQKARVEFCILMVWRDIARTRNSVSTNLLSIDELFDSALDDSGMQDMIDVLKGEDGNIFIISHKNVKSMFEHIYEITKEKYGFSTLTEL